MQKIAMTKKEILQDPSRLSYVIKVTPVNSTPFFIPVVDVRDGEEQREAVKNTLKTHNRTVGSKYIQRKFTFLGEMYN